MAFQIEQEQILAPPPQPESPQRSGKQRWQAEYRRRLRITDALVIAGAVAMAQAIRFGGLNNDARVDWVGDHDRVGYAAISFLLTFTWLGFLAVGNTWSPTVLGTGPEEYRRLVAATMRLFGLIAIVSLLLRIDFARGYLAIALPVGLLGLILNRLFWRKFAARKRRTGRYLTSTLVVGHRDSAREIMRCFERDPAVGYSVVGVYTPYEIVDEAELTGDDSDLPIVVAESSVVDAVRATAADTVVIAATEHLGTRGINDLLWKLKPLGVELVVTPGVVDVADQRLSITPVSNLPLLHIEKPQYDRAKSFGKAVFDLVFATLALLAVSPVMIFTAIAIKATSRGPVFYRSERIGLNGEPFRMVKFRSMYVDADRVRDTLLAENDGAGPLFKMREDPRVTPVGRILRKYSLDELPQFLNVIRGEMCVVGPRPPLRTEVEQYDRKMLRRLLVKPGVTGLWQVSGRSNLSWDESVRLDLSYVENWSMVQDLLIIKKTISAVTRSEGAY
ncbi:sugar transferase [Nocardia sp. 2]|uniref:Sugar transferase n=1 Tax=Nocardia acididurans TaxID=2802282 RepID=A0ABS1M063_9NOCA|nr:sugar transferase [Nocardia acididurans]MBL1074052.1 sugar transferase [Nocardia acididurans]